MSGGNGYVGSTNDLILDMDSNDDYSGNAIKFTQHGGTNVIGRITDGGYLYIQNLPGGGSGGTYDLRWISAGADSYCRYDSSSARYKENITDINFDTSPVYNLRPVSFDEKPIENAPDSYAPFLNDVGLIAEEVHEHIPALVTYKDLEDGNGPVPDAVNYSKLAVILLSEIKKLNERIKVLEDAS